MRWEFFFRPHWLPVAAASATLALIVNRGIGTVDPNWDTLAYHWPFAARIAGLCDVHCFLGSYTDEYRYDGFPKLWHAIQGLLWKFTGTPIFAPLLNIAMASILCAYLNRRFVVPLAWSWLAIIAIPAVQIQLTASYIDLPLNIAATLALMVVLRMIGQPAGDHRIDVATALIALGVAAGSKFQLVPVCLLIWSLIVALAVTRPSAVGLTRRSTTFVALGLAGAVVLLPKLALNAYAFGNPFYPIDFVLGPIHFRGPEPIVPGGSISDVWLPRPGPLRWLASIVEFDAFRGRPLLWMIGQGDVPTSGPSYAMGGYFAPYVLGSLAIFFWIARTAPKGGWIIALGVVLSVMCASMPHSHELRYYSFWMLTLVSTLLALVHSPMFERAEQDIQRSIAHALIAISAASVVCMTGGYYFQTTGPTLRERLRETDAVVAAVPEGGVLCILNRHRSSILYSDLFHASRHYQTRLLWSNEPAECTNRVDLDNRQ